jgi:serine phosphatase RsbU (regulator of sigma subunit)
MHAHENRTVPEADRQEVLARLENLDESERQQQLSERAGTLFGTLLAVVGVGWLIAATDLALLRAVWLILLLMLVLAALLNRLDFFWIIERRAGTYARWSAPMSGLVTTSAMLLYGPTAIWLGVFISLIDYIHMWRTMPLTAQRRSATGFMVRNLGCFSLGSLVSLVVYQRLGGSFPLPGLTLPAALLGFIAVLTLFSVDLLLWSCYLLIVGWTQLNRAGALDLSLFAKFEFVAYVPEFFAILAAATYSQMGLGAYLFLIAGALLVSMLAQRLSQAVDRREQRSRELTQLEQIGRAIIAAPPDGSTLTEVLAEFVPPMFRYDQIEVRLLSGQTLLHMPAVAPRPPEGLWDWLRSASRPHAVAVGKRPPWDDQPASRVLAVVPIVSIGTAEAIGGIYVRFSPTVDDPAEALPALQSLAAHIASALYRAEEYARTLAHQRMIQELTVAAEIQASLLPDTMPRIDGWQLVATLRPARQTSGDFYDVIELPDGRVGLLIADVTDKGTGAALFMALSRTLLRTYAVEYPEQPIKAFHRANKRILYDSRSSMFVTVFYGILDPASATLTYCNAGHNPPYVLRDRAEPQPLRNTGIPLGIERDAVWTARTVALKPGDLLVLYTDGISEAQNSDGELFEVERLLEAARSCEERIANTVQATILAAVDQFVGDAPQSDDMTILIVVRDPYQAVSGD